MHLSEIGHIAFQTWYEIPDHFPFIGLDAFVVMPNHIHGIIIINRFAGTPQHDATHPVNESISSISPKSGSLSVVIRSYKSAVTKNVHRLDGHFSWQR